MSNTEPASPPLNLPRFTFLVGGAWKQNFDFAKVLQWENSEVIIYDMRQPLYESASLLFLNTWDAVPDLEMQRFDSAQLPPLVHIGSWLDSYEEFLHKFVSPDLLGFLAAQRFTEETNPDASYVLLNCTYENIAPLVESDSIVACCGELKSPLPPAVGRFMWFPQPSPSERYALLKRELGTL